MIRIKGDRVVEVANVTSTYIPREDEIILDSLPTIELEEDEIAWIYYIDNQIVYKKEKRGNINAS